MVRLAVTPLFLSTADGGWFFQPDEYDYNDNYDTPAAEILKPAGLNEPCSTQNQCTTGLKCQAYFTHVIVKERDMDSDQANLTPGEFRVEIGIWVTPDSLKLAKASLSTGNEGSQAYIQHVSFWQPEDKASGDKETETWSEYLWGKSTDETTDHDGVTPDNDTTETTPKDTCPSYVTMHYQEEGMEYEELDVYLSNKEVYTWKGIRSSFESFFKKMICSPEAEAPAPPTQV